MKTKKPHKHKWSEQYRAIFPRPVRVCLNGACGAIRHASGHIVYVRDGRPKMTKTEENAVLREIMK